MCGDGGFLRLRWLEIARNMRNVDARKAVCVSKEFVDMCKDLFWLYRKRYLKQ